MTVRVWVFGVDHLSVRFDEFLKELLLSFLLLGCNVEIIGTACICGNDHTGKSDEAQEDDADYRYPDGESVYVIVDTVHGDINANISFALVEMRVNRLVREQAPSVIISDLYDFRSASCKESGNVFIECRIKWEYFTEFNIRRLHPCFMIDVSVVRSKSA